MQIIFSKKRAAANVRDRRDRRERRKRTPTLADPEASAYKGGSVLSSASLGMGEEAEKEFTEFKENLSKNKQQQGATSVYRKNGYDIFRLKRPNTRLMKNYPVVVVEPTQGWYPSKYASFKLSKRIDLLWIQAAVGARFNPSIWLWKDRKYHALRVPKNFKDKIKALLFRQGLWYSRTTNIWKKRFNFEKTQKESLRAQRDFEKASRGAHGEKTR